MGGEPGDLFLFISKGTIIVNPFNFIYILVYCSANTEKRDFTIECGYEICLVLVDWMLLE